MLRVTAVSCALCASGVLAGDLDPPPGPVAPTMLTLDTVEPRTPITQADIPLTISQGGSYFLAENVFPTLLNQPFMIRISSENVTLDLRGFTIIGATEVTTALEGVQIPDDVVGVTVHNGNIVGCLNEGVNAETGAEVTLRGLNVTGCGTGISVDAASLVESCRVSSCDLNGFQSISGGNTFVACQARRNGLNGIRFEEADTAIDCSAIENSNDGFQGLNSCVYESCTARMNGRDGFLAGFVSTLRGCNSMANDRRGYSVSACTVHACVALNNVEEGFISFSSSGAFSDCHANNNGGDGFDASAGDAFRGCTSTSNGGFGFDGSGGGVFQSCAARGNDLDGFDLGFGDLAEVCASSNNDGHGFDVSGARVEGCSASNNDLSGFRLGNGSTVIDCRSRQNGIGVGVGYGFFVEGTSNMLARCRADNNGDGEFQNTGGGSNRIGTIRTSLTNAGPWDNFDF